MRKLLTVQPLLQRRGQPSGVHGSPLAWRTLPSRESITLSSVKEQNGHFTWGTSWFPYLKTSLGDRHSIRPVTPICLPTSSASASARANFPPVHPRTSLVNQQRNPGQRAACECNDPEDNGDGGCGLPVSTPKIFRHADETGDLGGPRQLRGAAEPIPQSDCQYQHGAREIHIGVKKGVAERFGDPKIDQDGRASSAMPCKLRRPKVGESPDGLQSLTYARDHRCDPTPDPASRAPAFEAPIDRSRAVQAVVHQKRDEPADCGEQQPGAVPRAPRFTQFISAPASESRFENTSRLRHARAARGRKIEEAFEKENARTCLRQAGDPSERAGAGAQALPPSLERKSRQSPSPFP